MLDNVSNIESKTYEYDFSDFQDKMVLTRTKENIEQDILDKCKSKFKENITVTDVVVELNTKYNIEGIKVYVEKLEDVYTANKIMTYVTGEYNVGNEYIEVIQKENLNGDNK